MDVLDIQLTPIQDAIVKLMSDWEYYLTAKKFTYNDALGEGYPTIWKQKWLSSWENEMEELIDLGLIRQTPIGYELTQLGKEIAE